MAIPDTPFTRREMYLDAIAKGDASKIPAVPFTREEMYLAEIANGGGSGGASSLADLNDVEIATSSVGDNEPLLRFDGETQKWVNCSPKEAILGPYYNDGSGAIVLEDDAVKVRIGVPVFANSQTGQAFTQLFQAAITYGQYQADNLSKSAYYPLVIDAARAVATNADMTFYVVNANRFLLHSYRLAGAGSDYAVWSGVNRNNDKFYRITFAVICGENSTSASIVVKAEELMTYTEPT